MGGWTNVCREERLTGARPQAEVWVLLLITPTPRGLGHSQGCDLAQRGPTKISEPYVLFRMRW